MFIIKFTFLVYIYTDKSSIKFSKSWSDGPGADVYIGSKYPLLNSLTLVTEGVIPYYIRFPVGHVYLLICLTALALHMRELINLFDYCLIDTG